MEAILQFGLIDNGKVILKKEKDFLENEKQNIERTIEENFIKYIEEILNEEKITLKEIEKIRDCCTWNNQ